ncbi:MAG: DNA topoisomerase 3 [Deltaproteobacteria bacterium]|nr:DNA topoisomerase 3 [Deltaproteobacteria bacterium]
MTIIIVAEKPSVARDIAAVLGVDQRREGFLFGNGFAVTWAVGHLVALAEPGEIRALWRAWSLAYLPMLPRTWPLSVYERTRRQFEIVRKVLHAKTAERIVCATDAGREGELIFRYIYEAAEARLPVDRLWISSLTPEAIRDGFRALSPASKFDGLAASARARSRADWLVGLNLSRAYSLKFDDQFSVGRVQTPTLAMIVDREKAIRDFKPEPYLEVWARFDADLNPDVVSTSGASGAFAATSPPDARSSADADVSAPRQYRGRYFRGSAAALPSTEAARVDGAKVEETAGGDRGEEGEEGGLGDRGSGESEGHEHRLAIDGREANEILERARTGRADVLDVRNEKKKMPPPRLYDLSELQRHANRLWGFSANKTLEIAQSLYQDSKLLSYPRTDCRHMSREVAETLPQILPRIVPRYPGCVHPRTGQPLGRRFVDDTRVTEHHAILPTTADPARVSLSVDEARIYDLVCRRLLSAWHDDHVTAHTRVVTAVVHPMDGVVDVAGVTTDLYASSGKTVLVEGWKILDLPFPRRDVASGGDATLREEGAPRGKGTTRGQGASSHDERMLPPLSKGQRVLVADAEIEKKTTQPPKRLTDASLLTAMETCGKALDDRVLSDAMKERGLGTPATRAAIIETLIQRTYVERRGKAFFATPKGERLIDLVHASVKDVAMTGLWEHRLRAIERGEDSLDDFMRDIEAYVVTVVGDVRRGSPGDAGDPVHAHHAGHADYSGNADHSGNANDTRNGEYTGNADYTSNADYVNSAGYVDSAGYAGREPTLVRLGYERPVPSSRLGPLLKDAFGFDHFRPHQRAVCEAVAEGRRALLVMPTGAGKSLCYQLPGLARGRTLVVSPLIALMEDQVEKLSRTGLLADRIHSGRTSTDARAIYGAWKDRTLDYLFVAPERFRMKRFAEWLAAHPPDLIAVDEAHCISHWGHDFRPDYRLLGDHIRQFESLPVIAMTATATRDVQDDIVKQLGLERGRRFIHGFRRSNLAIEIVTAAPAERAPAVERVLEDETRRPAIVYASTRKGAEEIAARLAAVFPSAAYHAGLSSERREAVQDDFLKGRLEVIVATIAFGMGVDKADVRTVIHTGLPSSVEGYYQEIGRAGRDGEPARAVLLHSYIDVKLHDAMLQRDYPEVEALERVHRAIGRDSMSLDALREKLPRDLGRGGGSGWAPRNGASGVDVALEKLMIHGGAVVDENVVSRGPNRLWRGSYEKQRASRLQKLRDMVRLTEAHGCIMLQLIQHFGDEDDDGRPCGQCAVCAPENSVLMCFRRCSAREQAQAARVLDRIPSGWGISTGALYRETVADEMDRSTFEVLLGALGRAGLVRTEAAVFEKDGQEIAFLRVHRTDDDDRGEVDLSSLAVAEPLVVSGRSTRIASGSSEDRTPSRRRAERREGATRTRARPPRSGEDATNRGAGFEALRQWRNQRAKALGVPPYVVLADRTIESLLEVRPTTRRELLDVAGIGDAKADKFGAEILEVMGGLSG